MKTISQTLKEAGVGPRVIQKTFYGGMVGAGAAVWWWGFSITSIALGLSAGAVAGAVAGVVLVLLAAFAEVMISRK